MSKKPKLKYKSTPPKIIPKKTVAVAIILEKIRCQLNNSIAI
jgi:hypothetical protein